MNFNYKNPISPLSVLGSTSVPRTEVFGTNFSVLSTGGYMEVYSLSDLYFTIPSGTTGLVEFTGNTIPIQLNIGTGSLFSPDVLTLNSDNISSGRRRLGMLVYVIEEDQTYQFQIPNFESLWSGATGSTGPGGSTVIFSDFGTTIKGNSPQGLSFISAWTANTIEDISGETSTTAVWRKINTKGNFLPLTGGTVSGDTIFTSGLTANTFSASTYLGLPPDIYVTGFTYNNANTLTITRNQGEPPLNVTINNMTGLTVSGTVSSNVFSGGTFFGDGSGLTNLIYTGGTVSGGTLFLTGLSATTLSAATYQNLPIDPDTYVTGFTYSNNTFTITDNSGNTFNATFNDVTGLTINGDLTVTGNTSLNGLTANTISATTYLNLPSDIYITGGTFDKITETLTLVKSNGNSIVITGFTDVFVTGATYNSNTFTFTNNTGGTFNVGFNNVTGLTVNGDLTVTGNTSLNGLTANTISATTYQNLPIDPDTYVTGFTYNNNTLSINDNSGNTFNTTINDFTGLTINGSLNVTGNTSLNGLTANTISATTYQNLPIDIFVTGGTFSGGSIVFTNNTGGTFNVSGISSFDTFVTGFTYNNNTFTISQNSGTSLNATINTMTGLTVNGNLTVTGGTSFEQIGSSGDCVNDLYVSNIHSCSPLNINPLDEGNVYFGSTSAVTIDLTNKRIGINNQTPSVSLDISGSTNITGDITIGTNITATGGTRHVLGLNNDDLSIINTASSSYTTTNTAKNNTIINSRNSIIGTGTTNSSIIGSLNSSIGTGLTNTVIIAGNGTNTIGQAGVTNFNNKLLTSGLYIKETGSGNIGYFLRSGTGFNLGNSNSGTHIIMNQANATNFGQVVLINTTQISPLARVSIGAGATSTPLGLRAVAGQTANLLTLVNASNVFLGGFTAIGESTGPGYKSSTTSGITLTTTGSTIIANFGSGDTLNSYFYGGVYLNSTPNLNDTNTQLLSRNSSTGLVEFTSVSSITSTDTFVTGFTYSDNILTILQNQGKTPLSININVMTGLTINGNLTVTGNTTLNGLTANTISATTYQNLPIDVFVTGGTFSGGSIVFTNNTGGTFNVSGISSFDTFVTGFTYSNNTFTISQNSGTSLNATINTMTGLTVNGNLTVTGNTNVRALTGTTASFSAVSGNVVTITGSGTTAPLFVVQGSSGELFSITDSLVGSLFSVNDISGLPVIEVFSNNTVLMGSYLAPSLNTTTRTSLSAGTNNIYSIPTSAYTGAFFDYTLIGSGGARAGNIMSIWSGSTAQFTETSTTDIGITSGVTFSVGVSGGNAILSTSATTSGWTVNTIVRSI